MQMDKRSVLVDALAYLQDILHQTKIVMENEQNNISSTVEAATEDPGHAMVESSTSPDSSPLDVEINHPPCHHLGVVSDKNVVSVNVDGQPQTIEMLTVLVPSISPYSAIFPAITQMEAEKLDEERYLLKVVYNKAPRAMAQVQRSVEMLNGIQFIDVSISEYDQHHMQSSTFLRVKKAKGSVLVTDAENLVERVKTMVKQLGVLLPRAASSATDD
ncbi:hypothetical protein MKW98_026907 [Papaver atlanticum]|uniref:Uncharacterized protein n=1 Tax=Papaver atlanticum TaxID=357466 RepID=A0AAD4SVF7_9MAGN|nr:hypothetical protein MKW98_026907 [Papaver atlanticum]